MSTTSIICPHCRGSFTIEIESPNSIEHSTIQCLHCSGSISFRKFLGSYFSVKTNEPQITDWTNILNKNRGERIKTSEDVLLESPDFMEFAARQGINLANPTEGCDCEMCKAITRRNRATRKKRTISEMAHDNEVMHKEHEQKELGLPEEKTAADILEEGAEVYRERNKVYGDSYKVYGEVMRAMFPNGLPPLATIEDFNRLGVFNMIISKIMRYSSNLGTGGHRDSALDLSVYAAMLTELTQEKN